MLNGTSLAAHQQTFRLLHILPRHLNHGDLTTTSTAASTTTTQKIPIRSTLKHAHIWLSTSATLQQLLLSKTIIRFAQSLCQLISQTTTNVSLYLFIFWIVYIINKSIYSFILLLLTQKILFLKYFYLKKRKKIFLIIVMWNIFWNVCMWKYIDRWCRMWIESWTL